MLITVEAKVDSEVSFWVRFDSSLIFGVVYPFFIIMATITKNFIFFYRQAMGRDFDLISSRLRSKPSQDGQNLVVPFGTYTLVEIFGLNGKKLHNYLYIDTCNEVYRHTLS